MKEKKGPIHGFNVPDGYFDRLEDQLDHYIDQAILPESHGMHTPEGYFEGMEDRIMEAWKAEQRTGKIIPLYRRREVQWISAIAAVLLLTLMVLRPDTGSPDQIDQLSAIQMEDFLMEEMEWDVYELGDLMEDSEIEVLPDSELFSGEELEQYLLEHLDDNTLLIE